MPGGRQRAAALRKVSPLDRERGGAQRTGRTHIRAHTSQYVGLDRAKQRQQRFRHRRQARFRAHQPACAAVAARVQKAGEGLGVALGTRERPLRNGAQLRA
jgi:hypothetical protein